MRIAPACLALWLAAAAAGAETVQLATGQTLTGTVTAVSGQAIEVRTAGRVAFYSLDALALAERAKWAARWAQNGGGTAAVVRASTARTNASAPEVRSPSTPAPAPDEELRRAIRKGDITRVAGLLSAHPEWARPTSGESPLFDAVQMTPLARQNSRQRQSDVITLLLTRDADAGARTTNGISVLHMAVKEADRDSVVALLDRGAPVNGVDTNGNSVLHWAARYACDPDVFAALLDRGAHTAARNADGATPLHVAVASSCPAAAMGTLIARHAPVDLRDNRGRTPLHLAVAAGSLPCVELLMKAKARTDIADADGTTPLGLASSPDRLDIRKVLQPRAPPADTNAAPVGAKHK